MSLVVLACDGLMYAPCVSGAVNTQGFVWKFLCAIYIKHFHSFIPTVWFEDLPLLDFMYLVFTRKPVRVTVVFVAVCVTSFER